MDPYYSSHLSRLLIPQPPLQKLAVISIFHHLTSAPPHLSPSSPPGLSTISHCISPSQSPHIIDQSLRQLCRLVKTNSLPPSAALILIQSSLDDDTGSHNNDNNLISLYVKAIGFIVRFRFRGLRSEARVVAHSGLRWDVSGDAAVSGASGALSGRSSDLLEGSGSVAGSRSTACRVSGLHGFREEYSGVSGFSSSRGGYHEEIASGTVGSRGAQGGSSDKYSFSSSDSTYQEAHSGALGLSDSFQVHAGVPGSRDCEVHVDGCVEAFETFVKVVESRKESWCEVVRQIVLLVEESREERRFDEGCELLRRVLCYAVLREGMFEFGRELVVRNLSLGCEMECGEGVKVVKVVIACLKFCRCGNAEECQNFVELAGYVVDAYILVLRKTVQSRLLIDEAQLCAVELLEVLLSLCADFNKHFGQKEIILELSSNLLAVQKELHLQYIPKFSIVTTSLFIILAQAQFEHEQVLVLKLSVFLLKWKREKEHDVQGNVDLDEELLFIFPVVSLLSSPSKSIMAQATTILALLEEHLLNISVAHREVPTPQGNITSVTKSGSIINRLMQHLWSQELQSPSSLYFFRFALDVKVEINDNSWICQLREYCLMVVKRQKSHLLTQSQEVLVREISMVFGSIVVVMVLHPTEGKDAVDLLAVIAIMEPKVGLSMLMVILFYIKFFSNNGGVQSHELMLKLLEMLPSLALHPAMIPLIAQTIMSMLHRETKPVLRSTAIRLLCKTWEVNDRVFGSLQAILHPKGLEEFVHENNICLSIAASINDVCRKNPDRGVDLILSVSACIESQSSTVQTLGFQSLGHLCEADVIDFYTAWNVIAKHALNYSLDPIVAHGVCILLRWGAMDAEAYVETSKNLIQILWEVGTSRHSDQGCAWVKARCSAFISLTRYEVVHIQNSISDFKKMNAEFLISEENPEVLKALEGLEDKIISFEHITRRRLFMEKRVSTTKVEKLLDGFNQVIFRSGKDIGNVSVLPGASLVCMSFTPKVLDGKGTIKDLQKLNAAYENALVEIATSLHLSRNLLIAQLSLQSWKTFMQRWVKAVITLLDSKVPADAPNFLKALTDILKNLIKTAEESIPRAAENIALAICALCMVLPPSGHEVTASASEFLLKWLFEFKHEHRQWASALALGYISNCLHATDHRHKLHIITGLLEVSSVSKITLVKGACTYGLGISSQSLLTGIEVAVDSTIKGQETDLFEKIVIAISTQMCQFSPSSFGSLQSLCNFCIPNTINAYLVANSNRPSSDCNELEEDVWGVTGSVLALGNVICAVYQSGGKDAVLIIKDLLKSWIPHVNPAVPMSALTVGSCLALPSVVAICQRNEIIDEDELNYLVNIYKDLISELLCIKKSGIFHQSLLMASCIGAGNLMSCILDERVYSLKADNVKCLLELFRKTYTNSYPPTVLFGGMLGVVNALGAGAGSFLGVRPKNDFLHTGSGLKGSSYIRGPILATSFCEPLSTSLIQEIILVAQDSKNSQLQSFAAWAIAFLKHCWWYKNEPQSNPTDVKSASQEFPEDSAVWQLCLWLMNLNFAEGCKVTHVNTVTSVLRCLSRAPRLPSLDWGVIIRRCMRFEEQVSGKLLAARYPDKQSLREECVKFALAHANHMSTLLLFLDELSDLPRFITLELNLKVCLLCHLADLIKVFSNSRTEKLFDDISKYFRSSYEVYNLDQKSLLRVSFWSGLYPLLDKSSTDSPRFVANLEKCMESLFALLPSLLIDGTLRITQDSSEWSEVVKCLGRARRGWVMDFLKVSYIGADSIKKIKARTRLVMTGCTQLAELSKFKALIFNSNSDGVWDVLLEVVWALQSAESAVKREWLVDAVEISCITNFPSTSLQFIGLLSGSFCRYMPLLLVDRVAVLADMAVTLPSLLSQSDWKAVAEHVALYLWKSTERIYEWLRFVQSENVEMVSLSIADSEISMAKVLICASHRTCVSLKHYFPLDIQLRIASMVVS